MTTGLGILTFLIVLAVLILVHELGHFSFAKLMGVRVEEFGLGFPPRVRAWRKGGTLYSVNAIPIGGFVKMLGENGVQTQPDSFGAKPPWKRFVILTAGPGMNLLLALILYFGVFLHGAPRGLTVVTQVSPNSPASMAGLRVGDRIVQADGQPVTYLDQLQKVTMQHLGERVFLRLRRGEHIVITSLVPRQNPPPLQGPMGIKLEDTVRQSYGVRKSLDMAAGQVGFVLGTIPTVVQDISQNGSGHVTGPIGIAQITTHVVQQEPQQGFDSLLAFVALLSANLGILNLLPIPALDGGRIVFVLISWVRRRNLDPEVEGLIHMTGMALLLLLITVVSYQDIARWISGGGF